MFAPRHLALDVVSPVLETGGMGEVSLVQNPRLS